MHAGFCNDLSMAMTYSTVPSTCQVKLGNHSRNCKSSQYQDISDVRTMQLESNHCVLMAVIPLIQKTLATVQTLVIKLVVTRMSH